MNAKSSLPISGIGSASTLRGADDRASPRRARAASRPRELIGRRIAALVAHASRVISNVAAMPATMRAHPRLDQVLHLAA